MPALLLLDEPKHAESIPLLTRTFRMPEPDARGRTAVVASVPLDALTFEARDPSMPPAGRLTLLARVENKKADVVHYAAETYDFTARSGQSDATGSILFFTAAALPREPLSVAVAAYDALGQKGTVRTEPLSAPTEKSGDLLVGDLILATRMQPRQSATQRSTVSGLPFGDVVLVPNLGDPVPAGSPLIVAFQALADRTRGGLSGSLDLTRNGAVVTSLPLRLPQPKDDGSGLRLGSRPTGWTPAATF